MNRGSIRSWLCRRCYLVVPFLILLPSLLWTILDRSVWPWDQAWYGEVSIELYDKLNHDRGEWSKAMTSAFGIKTPGISWLGQFFVPLGQLLGSIDLGLHLSVLLCQGVTLVLVFRIAQALFPERGIWLPLAGCLLVGSAPLFVGLSHQYLVEPMQTLAVTWVFYAVVMSPRHTRLQRVSHLLASGSLAMLAKVSSPAYCLLPGLWALVSVFFRNPTDARTGWFAVLSHWLFFGVSLLLFASALAWYQENWPAPLKFAQQSASGEVSLHYGRPDVFLVKLAFWIKALQTGLFTPVAFWFALLLTAGGIVLAVRRFRKNRRISRLDLLVAICLVHVLLFLTVAARSNNEDPRFLLPLLPALAILCLRALAAIPGRWIVPVFIAVFLAQWAVIHATAFGYLKGTSCFWVIPCERDATKLDEVVKLVASTSDTQAGEANRTAVIGVELPWLNEFTCSYYAAQHNLVSKQRGYFIGLGYAETNEERAFHRVDAPNAQYFITLSGDFPKDDFNQVSEGIARRVARDSRYVPVNFRSSSGILVYRRTPILPIENKAGSKP